jgi:hypothetical protein
MHVTRITKICHCRSSSPRLASAKLYRGAAKTQQYKFIGVIQQRT